MRYQYLSFNVNILKCFGLWLDENERRNLINSTRAALIFATISPIWLMVCQSMFNLLDPTIDIVLIMQQLLASSCVNGALYLATCFCQNRARIKRLVDSISEFSAYSELDLKFVDKKASFFSKIFFFYTIAGVMVYCLFPLIMKERCSNNSPQYFEKYGVPCGVILHIRMPWRYETAPLFPLMAALQMLTASLTSIFIVNLTMLVCGLIEHAIHQLREVRKCVVKITACPEDRMEDAVKSAVKYHCKIIDFVDQINAAFGSQLVLHFTLISLVISILGFEILIVTHKEESLMYILHLIGWFMILYNVCHYGQLLINESCRVAEDAYSMPWYDCPVKIQKDIKLIILRSQKPLTLKALSLGTWSDPAFLGVITSSYSYFTLLLKLINK